MAHSANPSIYYIEIKQIKPRNYTLKLWRENAHKTVINFGILITKRDLFPSNDTYGVHIISSLEILACGMNMRRDITHANFV
ncbi:hypothetical protein DOY81_007485 [Sarcophaga bullata]|nr:hypothetical protein DOY81_007485 [Sarcophaga bullata]